MFAAILHYLLAFPYNFDQMLQYFTAVSTVNINQHIAPVFEVTAYERRWCHIFKCYNLDIRVFILNLRYVPKHKVPTLGMFLVSNIECCAWFLEFDVPSSIVVVTICIVVYAEDFYIILKNHFTGAQIL